MRIEGSRRAKVLIENEFVSNGCGSGFLSVLVCLLAQVVFDKDTRKNLQKCWVMHDAEYSISTAVKSKRHKRLADEMLANNLDRVFNAVSSTILGKYSNIFVKTIHTLLVVGGDSAYWSKKKSRTTVWTNIAVTLVLLYGYYLIIGG